MLAAVRARREAAVDHLLPEVVGLARELRGEERYAGRMRDAGQRVQRGYIGVALQNLDEGLAAALNLDPPITISLAAAALTFGLLGLGQLDLFALLELRGRKAPADRLPADRSRPASASRR